MLTDEKIKLLRQNLGALPERAAVRLAKAVEVDRLAGGTTLPHELLLDCLRPVLRRCLRHERTPTPLRYFCLPFEDLLFSGLRKEKRKGCISRSVVLPIWIWLEIFLIPNETIAYADELKAMVLMGDEKAYAKRAAEFWLIAGKAMYDACANDPVAVREYFANDFLAADAEEMAILLLAGPLMMEVRKLFPKPTPALTEEHFTVIRDIYDRVIVSVPDAAPYLPVVAMERLEKPWEAIRLALAVTRQSRDTLISSTDMWLVGEILYARMEEARAAIHAMRQPDFDADVLIDRLTDFTLLSSAIAKEVDILRSGKWGKRLLADRAAVGAALEVYMERAPKEIAAAIPLKRSGFTGGSMVPDFTRKTDEEKCACACRYAKVLASTSYLASAASFAAKHTKAHEAAVDMLGLYNEALVKELRAPDVETHEVVEHQFEVAVNLTRVLFSAKEAEFLRRRGRAARAA